MLLYFFNQHVCKHSLLGNIVCNSFLQIKAFNKQIRVKQTKFLTLIFTFFKHFFQSDQLPKPILNLKRFVLDENKANSGLSIGFFDKNTRPLFQYLGNLFVDLLS